MQTNTPSNFTLADGAGHTFFERQAQPPQFAPQRRCAHRDRALGAQPGAQLGQCEVRAQRDRPAQRLAVSRQAADLYLPGLERADLAGAGAPLPRTQHIRDADVKQRGDLARRQATIACHQHALPQAL